MTDKSTIEQLLADIQLATLEDLLAKIKSGECDSRILSVAVKLLKDNNITCDVRFTPAALKLRDELPEFDDRPESAAG